MQVQEQWNARVVDLEGQCVMRQHGDEIGKLVIVVSGWQVTLTNRRQEEYESTSLKNFIGSLAIGAEIGCSI